MVAPIRLPVKAKAPPARTDPIFGARSRAELEFLPEALEIVETPPPPLPRIAALTLVALLVTTIAWAALGKVDVVSTAPGRLVPAGGGKIVQPLETGTVKSIRVHDGDHVHKGDTLVELEPTETLADRDQLGGELSAAKLEVARLEAVALGRSFASPNGIDSVRAAIAAREARAEIDGNTAKLSGLDREVDLHRSELASAQAEQQRLIDLLPLSVQRTAVFSTLEKKGYGSRLQLIEAQEKQKDAERSIDVERQKIPGLEATIQSTLRQRAEVAAEFSKKSLADLTDAQVKAASLADELTKAEERLKDRTLLAPVDGTVQEVSIHTVGGVVEPGQTLMRVAPAGAAVEVEANLENKDVGFVRSGMPAEVKVETFPFTRYGVINARVVTVSADAVNSDMGPILQGAIPSKSDPHPHYLVRLSLDRDTMDVDGQQVSLTPGMMITAEIKTGKRRVISYIMSPLAKATREAGRER